MPTGNIDTGAVQYGTGIEVQIESYLDNVLSLLVYDTRLGNIARVRYPAMSDISFTCSTTCAQDSISFSPASNDISYQDGFVFRNSQKLFSVADVFSYPNLSFAFIHQDSKNLQFALSFNGLYLGVLSLQWKSHVPAQGQIISNLQTITVESLRSTLLTKLAWSNMSSYETPSLLVYNA